MKKMKYLFLLSFVILSFAQTEYKVQPGWNGNEIEIEISDVLDVYGSTVLIIAEDYPTWIQIKNDSQPLKVFGPESIPVKFTFDVTEDIMAGESGTITINVYKDNELFGTKEINLEVEIPKEFTLEQNYPNPFNPSTTIKFQIPKKSRVKLLIFNTLGEIVETIFDKELESGYYKKEFDASKYASGRYFYKLISPEKVITKKMILVK